MSWDNTKFIKDEKIVISEGEATYALREAWKQVYGDYPSNKTLSILWAQTCLETGRFKVGFHCYNWGNIKSKPDDGHYWTMFPCSEIINGREIRFVPPHDQCKFRAYMSATEGAVDYLKFLQKSRYKKALEYLKQGDVIRYTTALSVGGYFTASLTKYLAAMTRLSDEWLRKAVDLLQWRPPEPERHDAIPPPPPENIQLIPLDPGIKLPDPPEIKEEPEPPDFKPKQNLVQAGIFGTIIVAILYVLERLFN